MLNLIDDPEVTRCVFRYIVRSLLFDCVQDDMQVRVFNYNTLERVYMFEAHSDYIRCIAVHPTQSYILTSSGRELQPPHILTQTQMTSLSLVVCFVFFCCGVRLLSVNQTEVKLRFLCSVFSDDMLIKMWDWDRKWLCSQVFEGHTHYVMQIVINPRDNNQFASASLDRTIKVYTCTEKQL